MSVIRDWNYWLAIGSNTFGQIIETVMIVFLTFEFKKPHSDLKHAYYYVLYISYWIDTFGNIVWWISEALDNEPGNILVIFGEFYKWYFLLCPSAWSLILSLNRCTAMGWPMLHKKIWSGKSLIALILLMILYPFLVDGRSFWNINCMYSTAGDCMNHYKSMMVVVQISTVSASAVSFILIAVAIRQSKSYLSTSMQAKVEKRMILHAAIASGFLLLWVTNVYLSSAIFSMYQFFDNLSFFIFFLQHYPPMLLILWLNPIYKNLFFRFIGAERYIKKEISISGSVAQIFVLNQSAYQNLF